MHALITANKLDALATALGDFGVASSGMAPSRYAALVSLHHRQPMTVTALAAILGLSQPATTRLIQSLQADGLVRQGRKTGREVELGLTRAGIRLAARLQERRLRTISELLAPLNKADRRTFDGLLSTLLAGLVRDDVHARHMCRNCDHGICSGKACPVGEEIRNNRKKHK